MRLPPFLLLLMRPKQNPPDIKIYNGCLLLQVEGINGMYLANKQVNSQVKSFITYNKGQTWALLPAPAVDVAGNNLNCILVSLSDQ